MHSNNCQETSEYSSKSFTASSKEFRFPKVKTRVIKHKDPKLSFCYFPPDKKDGCNSSCGSNYSLASRSSELSFGCDKQVEIKISGQRKIKNTFIDDNFMEYSDTESQLKYRRPFYQINKPRSIEQSTQTDEKQAHAKTYLGNLKILICGLIVTGFIFYIFQDLKFYFHKSNLKHSDHEYKETESLQKEMDESTTALDIINNKRHDDKSNELNEEFIKMYENMKDTVQQLQSKLSVVEKEVALFQQYGVDNNQLDNLVYGYLYGPAADYALETTGGSVIDTPGTTSYTHSGVTVSLFGIPVWKHAVSHPRIIIKGGMQPGQCWSFHGSEGRVVIRLAYPIKISGISLEHFPSHLLPSDGDVLSAPRHFSVTAYNCKDCSERDKTIIGLGSFDYVKSGPPRQTFPIQQEIFLRMLPMQFVEFHFKSNYGNPTYTCIYRVRVHGVTAVSQ